MNAVEAAIYTTLSAGTALTSLLAAGSASLHHLEAPEGTEYPYVVWSHQGGGDENLSPHRTKNIIRFIRAYSETSAAEAGTIDAAIDTLLHMTPLTISGWADLWLARETDVELVEDEPSGRQIFMQGGMYRLLIEKT